MLTLRRPLVPMAVLAAMVLFLPGCGPKYPETIPVSGTVTLDGQPVAGAAVVFTPEEGKEATATTDPSGRFELSTFQLADGAVPGKHRVTVSKITVEPGEDEKAVFLVPKEYGNAKTSQLTCDVQKEMGPVQFDLRSEPEPVSSPKPEEGPPAVESSEPAADGAPVTDAAPGP